MKCRNNHLMYCLNIHPGEHWEENLSSIRDYSLEVKNRICPDDPFALGLRLSAIASRELLPKIEAFSIFLEEHDMYVVSVNGFPYGTFHGGSIKEKVYLPDWSSPLRVSYTLDLAEILAHLLPEGETGTISSVPCNYGEKETDRAFDHLQLTAEALKNIKEKTGRHIILCLEPEPDCRLDHLDNTIVFFRRLYSADESVQEHVGVCLDTCHAAVEFESPLLWLQRLAQEGISVPKIQISAALWALITDPEDIEKMFTPFIDQEYLHQTRVLVGGKIHAFRDLPAALAAAPCGEWRVHFHVPLTWTGKRISSTAPLYEDVFFNKAFLNGGRHFEVETYSFHVLPDPKPPITESIVSEMEWVLQKMNYAMSHIKVSVI